MILKITFAVVVVEILFLMWWSRSKITFEVRTKR